MVQLSHPNMTTGKTVTLTRSTFITKVMSLLFNMLSSFSFKDQKSFNFMAAVTIQSDFGGQGNKICHCFYFFPIYLPGSNGMPWPQCFLFIFIMLSFKSAFSLFSFTHIKRHFSSSLLFAIRVISSAYLRLSIRLLAILIPFCDSPSLAIHMMYSVYKLK